ncbi:Hsp20/alpha crystallin family protein [Kroppenstedtia eburnea]|uniref:HSP20 family protein n=1 Tax=Kroppenstedtia eburnea TaxID=714067 RepID=A0A1N7PVY6_9BACL|nr:Hsp20/alpha crystallin family protein [Kroppenstedtia eburnea]EGK09195.1 heat shock protein [Desmospora sp. 8437]QKI80927.1 Hsp20/alpha crystallin family protein [Kroppenstedtia eburnea]SIT14756.1 HSP20 family protein [Kroppenstedtia eburnea]
MKKDSYDWSNVQGKVGGVFGDKFWNELHQALPRRGPGVDIYETEREGVIVVEIPGLSSPNDIQITLESQNLILQGEIPYGYPVPKEKIALGERRFGRFKRRIQLPFHYSPDRIQASYKSGLLEIRLLKEMVGKEVEVRFEEESS